MNFKHYYIEKGEGFPLILLHGNSGNMSCFKAQIKEFSKDFHVYALDTRGHGKSKRGEAPFTIKQFADDLANFMNEHEIKKAHILGFSDGGNIALEFVLKYPEKVEKLILNGANFVRPGLKFYFNAFTIFVYFVSGIFKKISKKALAVNEMYGLMVNEPNITLEELASIKAQTLVIAGTHDIVKESHTRLMADTIPHAKLVLINGNHSICYKKPLEYNAAVAEFIRN
ncbi:MAG: alpha/beta hydrolase [Lachnospiraceae bacterium]|nr:alpha/beta hydrolase [Lachnospiraceae bacterium]